MRFVVFVIACLGLALPPVARAADAVGVVVRYRTVFEQIEPPVRGGRWSESTALRLRLDGAGSVAIEGLTDKTSPQATSVTHHDGEIVDMGAYRATYTVDGTRRVTIRSDYADFVLTRDVRISGGRCSIAVTYAPRGSHGASMRLASGVEARFSRIFAVDAGCRVDAPGEADAPLARGCVFAFDRDAETFTMEVARGGTCVGRIAQRFPDRTVTLVSGPAHGSARIVKPGAIHYAPDADHVGRDRMEVEVRARTPNGPRVFRRVIEVRVVP